MSEFESLDVIGRQTALAEDESRRPWPLPTTEWAQAQTRRDGLLAHWRVELDQLARLLPPELAVDVFEGEAWVGIAAYRVEHMRVRGLPPLPGLSSFPQLEVRTYVSIDGRPGIWLFSLEAPKSLLVEAAKRAHRLPAYHTKIAASSGSFEATRDGLGFRARWQSSGEGHEPEAGTFERFATERYALYTEDGGRLYAAQLNQSPTRLAPAQLTVEEATIAPLLLEGTPVANTVETQDVLIWPLEEL